MAWPKAGTKMQALIFNRVQMEMEIQVAPGGARMRVTRCDTAPANDLPAGMFHCLTPGCKNTVCKLHNCARGEHKQCPRCGESVV